MKTFEQNGVTYGVIPVPENATDFALGNSIKFPALYAYFGLDSQGYSKEYDTIELPDTHTYSILGIVKELTEAQCAELIYVGQIYDTTNTDKTYKLALQMLLQVVLGFNPDDNILILKVENK